MFFKKHFFYTFSIQIVVILMVTLGGPVYSVFALPIELTENAQPSSDPTLVWNTFLGGSPNNLGSIGDALVSDLTVDGSGNVYVAGVTDSNWGNPVRAFTTSLDEFGYITTDAFVAKLDSSGNMIWHTFLGGSGNDSDTRIAIDENDNVYVTGNSAATWGNPLQSHDGSTYDAFVATLNSSGVVMWNTFLSGSGQGIAVDESGDIYVSGTNTVSWGNPVNPLSGGRDVSLAKLDPSGTLVWNTFLGGNGSEYGFDIVIGNGNIYAVGRSDSSWGNPLRHYLGGTDTLVTKLNSSSGVLLWNTFLGGTGNDYGSRIAVDGVGNVYITGISDDLWGSPVRAYTEGSTDGFAAKLNSSGMLMWNTFLGGGGEDYWGWDISVDGSGGVYVMGNSSETWDDPLLAYSGNGDSFVANLGTSGVLTQLIFLGGNGSETGYGITIDGEGNGYVVGLTTTSWGTPVRAYQGNIDGFVTKVFLSLPIVSSSTRLNNNPTNLAIMDFTMTFSEDVTGVDISDFSLTTTGSLSGTTVNQVSGTGSVYTVTVNTGSGDGTIRLDVKDDDTILDTASNPLGGAGIGNGDFTSGETYSIDKTAPTILTITRTNSNPSAAMFVNFLVTFSEPVTNINKSDFSLAITELIGASVNNVSGTGATRIVKVNTGSGDGILRLDALDNDTITDLAGNSINGGFSSGEVYTVDKPDLPAPILRSPRSNMISNNMTPTLWWTAVKGAGSYEIELASDNTFTSIEDNNTVNGVSYVVSASLGNGIHYWRVRARNLSNQAGAWSSTRNFTIDTTGPVAPQLNSPLDSVSLNRTPTFRWGAVTGAVLYEFQYDNDVDFSSPYRVTTRGTFRRPPAMKPGTYYWHVRAKDAVGNWGDWSMFGTITITSP